MVNTLVQVFFLNKLGETKILSFNIITFRLFVLCTILDIYNLFYLWYRYTVTIQHPVYVYIYIYM